MVDGMGITGLNDGFVDGVEVGPKTKVQAPLRQNPPGLELQGVPFGLFVGVGQFPSLSHLPAIWQSFGAEQVHDELSTILYGHIAEFS